MSVIPWVPIIVVIAILGTDSWVYADARGHAVHGDPVVFTAGSVRLDTPEVWAAVCLVLWVLCFPLYLASRHHPV